MKVQSLGIESRTTTKKYKDYSLLQKTSAYLKPFLILTFFYQCYFARNVFFLQALKRFYAKFICTTIGFLLSLSHTQPRLPLSLIFTYIGSPISRNYKGIYANQFVKIPRTDTQISIRDSQHVKRITCVWFKPKDTSC